MSVTVVVEQMIMIVLLIALGFYAYRKSIINDAVAQGISAVIVTFTNPCLMAHSMLASGERVSGRLLVMGLLSVAAAYVFLIAAAQILPVLLRVEKSERYCYWLLCVCGNIGFIGIPLTSAVLGNDALVYVAFHNLAFALIIYTVGINKIRNEAEGKAAVKEPIGVVLKRFVNVGTVSIIAALIMYIAGLNLPGVVMSAMDYTGRSTTFLSMMVLGVAVAKMSFKRVVTNVRLIIFAVIRLTIIPVLLIFLLRLFVKDALIMHTAVLMLAVPAGNMPLIIATQYGLDAHTISDGIVLTTVLSVITIPLVILFV